MFNSAALGSYIHGLAGELAGKDKYSVKASDVIECIPKVMNHIADM